MINYRYDDIKAIANINKHGVSFDEAITVFDDFHALVFDDPDHSTFEERFIIVGLSRSGRNIFVSHCYTEEEIIRIISARKATKREETQYWSRR
jgi:uncharacterized DUF497 family protein